MRFRAFCLLVLGIPLSGCAGLIIVPAEVEKSANGDGAIKYRRPTLAVEPFGEGGGQLHLKYSRNNNEIGIQWRKKF